MAKSIKRLNYYELQKANQPSTADLKSSFAEDREDIVAGEDQQIHMLNTMLENSHDSLKTDDEKEIPAAETTESDNISEETVPVESDDSDHVSSDTSDVVLSDETDKTESVETSASIEAKQSVQSSTVNDIFSKKADVDAVTDFKNVVSNMKSLVIGNVDVVSFDEPVNGMAFQSDDMDAQNIDDESDDYSDDYSDESDASESDNDSDGESVASVKTVFTTTATVKDTTVLKPFPKSLVEKARYLFPGATNNQDAVAAYIYLKEGQPSDLAVPDGVKAAARSYIGENVSSRDIQLTVDKNLRMMDARIRTLLSIAKTIELGIAYDICNNIGFIKKEQLSPGDIEFLEQGVLDLFNKMEKQSADKVRRDTNREGRPKSQK